MTIDLNNWISFLPINRFNMKASSAVLITPLMNPPRLIKGLIRSYNESMSLQQQVNPFSNYYVNPLPQVLLPLPPFSSLIEMSSTDQPSFPSLPQELIQDGQPQA